MNKRRKSHYGSLLLLAGMLLAVLPNTDPDADQGEAHG